MVYASVPAYVDPPNWNQQQSHQQLGGNCESQQLQPPVQSPQEGGRALPASRPMISMADRARQAKLPQPEQALKCPRCDSGNTKFCYFNNYSLTQPRHFCKTCRRYWTRGGTLRNVPVGGGCRRNKRSKSSSSRSTTIKSKSGTSSTTAVSMNHAGSAVNPNMVALPQLPFMTSLHPLDYNFTGIQNIDRVDYQMVGGSSLGLEQWRPQQVQQFPLFTGLGSTTAAPTTIMGLYQFEGEGSTFAGHCGQVVHGQPSASGLILPKQYLTMPGGGQCWPGGSTVTDTSNGTVVGSSSTSGGHGWTDLAGFNSSSTGNFV